MSSSESNNSDLFLIKLGGSLITDKRRPQTARTHVITRLANEIREASMSIDASFVIGHGSGSFGHRAAEESGIHRGVESQQQLAGVGKTQGSAAALHTIVFEGLIEAGVPAFSLSPSSFAVAAGGTSETLWPEPLLLALELGLVPTVYGDVVMDREWGASIYSTESLFLALVPALASRGRFVRGVIWLGETEGVFDAEGNVISEIESDEVAKIAEGVSGASGVDVTGGMRHRLEAAETLARLGVTSWIGNGLEPGHLIKALTGEAEHGTLVHPGR
jgi:isopentenyl phosphate kinase